MTNKLPIRICAVGLSFLMASCAIFQNKKKDQAASAQKEESKDGLKPYAKVITKDAKSDEGLFTVHKVKNKYYYEIPDSLFNRENLTSH